MSASAHTPVIVLTGASKGIGLAVAKILLETFDARVVAISRTRSPELLELLERHTTRVLTVECDVTDEEGLTRAIGLAEKTFGAIDGMILNAGVIDPMGRIDSPEITLSQWKSHFDVNFFSLVTALRAALPTLRKSQVGGRVVFVSSGSAVSGMTGGGPYNAGKAAMNSLCRTIANEEPDVAFVAVRPGMVNTAMQDNVRANVGSMSEQDKQRFLKPHADGTLLRPEDPGHVIAALALKAPKTLSGQFVSWDKDECAEFRRK